MSALALRRLAPLTSLRFFAAAMIVAHHLRGHWGIPLEVGAPFVLDNGVSFFFVLSGFILTYAHPRLDTREARGRFLLARFARVWPAHAFGFLVWLVLMHDPVGGAAWHDLWLVPLNLSMLHAWVPLVATAFSFNDVSWTISTEWGFYALFPFWIARLRSSWWWKLDLAAALLIASAWICRLLDLPVDSPDPWRVTQFSVLYFTPFARSFEFVLGMSFALLLPGARAALQRRPHLATAVEVAALATLAYNASQVAAVADRASTAGGILAPLSIWLVHGGACCPTFALTILVFGCEAGLIARLLSLRILVLLGEVSFSIYVLHRTLLNFVYARSATLVDFSPTVQVAAYCVSLVLLSHCVWAVLERPLRTWFVALWPLATPRPPESALRREAAWSEDGDWLFAPGARVLLVELGIVAVLAAPIGLGAWAGIR